MESSLPCNTCHLLFPNREELTAHYKGELHRTNLILVSRKQPILTQEQFDQAKAAELKAKEEAENDKKAKHSKKKKEKKEKPISTGSLLSRIHTIPPNENQQAEQPSPKEVKPNEEEEEEDQEEFNVNECRDIPSTECLFCGKTFDTPDLCYTHMKEHNFYFVYEDKLVDREGLMKYFGEKVGVGNCCLLCSKQFQSIRSCRQHMISKYHCVYDFDDEVEEFYSPETAVVPVKYTIDELGELHLPDGTIYGHRKYARFYKQRVPSEEQMKKGIRKAIAGPTAPRESINIENDKVLQRREFYKQKYITKRLTRVSTREYNPMSDIHRGNA